jgi:hypothetical protein
MSATAITAMQVRTEGTPSRQERGDRLGLPRRRGGELTRGREFSSTRGRAKRESATLRTLDACDAPARTLVRLARAVDLIPSLALAPVGIGPPVVVTERGRRARPGVSTIAHTAFSHSAFWTGVPRMLLG